MKLFSHKAIPVIVVSFFTSSLCSALDQHGFDQEQLKRQAVRKAGNQLTVSQRSEEKEYVKKFFPELSPYYDVLERNAHLKYEFDRAAVEYDHNKAALGEALHFNLLHIGYPKNGFSDAIDKEIDKGLARLDSESKLSSGKARSKIYNIARRADVDLNLFPPVIQEEIVTARQSDLFHLINQMDNAISTYDSARNSLRTATAGFGDPGDSVKASPDGYYRWNKFYYQTFERPWDPGAHPRDTHAFESKKDL